MGILGVTLKDYRAKECVLKYCFYYIFITSGDLVLLQIGGGGGN